MNKSNIVKLLALIFAAIMLVSFLVACGEGSDGSGGGADVPEETEEIICVLPAPEWPSVISRSDYDGYAFTFLVQNYKDEQYNLVFENETSDVLPDAVYRRNDILKERYNINFELMKVTDLIATVRTEVKGGSTSFDMIIGDGRKLAALAKENVLYDLLSIKEFDMDKPYWDSNAAEQLKVGDKLYFTNCDLNVQEVAFVVYFNKALIEENTLTSPYEYMANNQWTIDNWANLVMAVSSDVDGGGTWDENDMYGTLYEYHNGRMFLYGAGVRATTNDETGYPVVTLFETDKAVTVYEKCKAVFGSVNTLCINTMSSQDTHGYNDKYDYARSLFCQDLYLFHYEGTNIIHQFADMESEFGVVPFPKYDSNQSEYYSMYPYNCAMVAIPNVVEDLERTANIIEDMNYYSSIILKPAWYDTLLSRRYTRDDESEQSLDIILEGRVYDVGMYYNFGGICSNLLDADVRTSNISTMYARLKKSIDAEIKAIYRDFGKN